jgi:release factor glutamine methyltransferase
VLDQLCTLAPKLVADGGTMMLVQSEFANVGATMHSLRAAGMSADVVARQRIPFGPVLRARAAWLQATGQLRHGRRDEVLVVIRADKRRRLDV